MMINPGIDKSLWTLQIQQSKTQTNQMNKIIVNLCTNWSTFCLCVMHYVKHSNITYSTDTMHGVHNGNFIGQSCAWFLFMCMPTQFFTHIYHLFGSRGKQDWKNYPLQSIVTAIIVYFLYMQSCHYRIRTGKFWSFLCGWATLCAVQFDCVWPDSSNSAWCCVWQPDNRQ